MTCPLRLSIAVIAIFVALASVDSKADETKPVHPYLYQVKINGHTSWIIGTMHTPYVKIEDFHPSLKGAILDAKLVLTENISEHGGPSIYDKLRSLRSLGGDSLKKRLSPGAWNRLQNWLKIQFPKDTYKSAHELLNNAPAGAVLYVLENFADQAYVSENEGASELDLQAIANHIDSDSEFKVFDEQLIFFARQNEKKIENLDHHSYLIRTYADHSPPAALNDYLMIHLDRDGRFVSQTQLKDEQPGDAIRIQKEGAADYANGKIDLEFIEPEVKDPGPYFLNVRKLYENHIVPRHVGWFPRILQEMRKGPVTITAGLNHVADSKNGLIKLLQGEGAEIIEARKLFGDTEANCKDALK